MPDQIKLAIVLPSIRYNLLRTALKQISLLDPLPDIIILVVPYKFIKKIKSILYYIDRKINIIILVQRKGLIEARNKGIVAALRYGAELIWLFEDDIIILNRNIIKLIKYSYRLYKKRGINIGIIFGRQIIESLDRIQRPLQRMNLTKNKLNSILSNILYKLYKLFLDMHGYNGLPYLVPAATIILTKEAIMSAGLFYDGFEKEAEWSEPDLIVRILNKNFKVIKLKNFIIKHFILSIKYFSISYWLRRLRNILLYIIRNRGFRLDLLVLASFFIFGSFMIFIYDYYKLNHGDYE